MGLYLTTPSAAALGLSLLLGWLVGGLSNWAADVLPGRGAASDPEAPRTVPTAGRQGPIAALHYLTLPWYPFRGGVCPHCGARRPFRAPLLEAATILAFVLADLPALRTFGVIPGPWSLTPDPWSLAVICLYAAFLLAVLVIDLEHRRVLNIMVAPAAVVALLASLLPGGPTPVQALIGGALGFGVFFLLALIGRGAMGMGDVKLAGVIGLMTGYPLVVAALALGIVLGGVAAIALLVTRRAGRKGTMAYAPYLALGTIVVLLL
jgi:leader peptidase (prepilin peptidase)/N-methyltransferase